MAKKKLILHDLNGCLIDDILYRHTHGVCAIFRHFGLEEPSLQDYSTHITSNWIEYCYERGVPRGINEKEDMAFLNKIMVDNLATVDVPPLFPETEDFLSVLRGHKTLQILVSSLVASEFNRQVTCHNLGRFFAEMHSDIRKKAPLFRQILERHDIDPTHAVGVTDTMSDVAALQEAGVRAIIVPRPLGLTTVTRNAPTYFVADDLLHALTFMDL